MLLLHFHRSQSDFSKRASLRTSVQAVLDDMSTPQRQTQLSEVVKKRGGKYRGQSPSGDTLLFSIYTSVEFMNMTPDWRGLSVSLSIDTPPGRARSTQSSARARFWEGSSGKRLLSGGLVALVWQERDGLIPTVHLGTISSSLREHVDSAKHDANRLPIRVSFFDHSIELRILQDLHTPRAERGGCKMLVEATVMFEAIRPFLEALRVEPTTLPFSKYLVHHPEGVLSLMTVDPPRYATLPGFSFELASLFPEGTVDSLKLIPSDPRSIEGAREQLRQSTQLDPSQADSVIDALTREVALIQG